MKIIAISDLHGYLPKLESADLLIIAGDISPLYIQDNLFKMDKWFIKHFCPWINSLNINKVILVAGNHDYWFFKHGKDPDKILTYLESPTNFKVKYLENEAYNYISSSGEIIKLFGTPYCKIFGDWPFMESYLELTEIFSTIPVNIDILVSHDPPFGVCDVDIVSNNPQLGHLGNKALFEKIVKVKPKLVICGHIHSGKHTLEQVDETEYVNVSLLDEYYEPSYNYFIYEKLYNL